MFKIANNLSLPVEAVTQAFALVGRRGSGKSTTAVDLAEEMLKRAYPIAIIDPTGVWWGLQSSADGKHPGYPIIIFGGKHGHVPLEATGGKLAADFVVAERLPVIFDLCLMGENEMRRFVADFAKQLYRTNSLALHLFVDEADEFAPQSASGGALAECHGAMQNIVRRGRAKGIGVSLITQRTAVIDKSILYQTECLIAMQLTGPLDVAAVDGWIKYHGSKEERDKILGTLPGLERGDGWVYSPSWLKVLKRVTFRPAETFDSRQTPKPGQPQPAPKRTADVDLGRVQKQMAATVQAARANDPKELRKEISELKKQLAAGPPKAENSEAIVKAEGRGEARGRQAVEAELRQLRSVVNEREGRLSKVATLSLKILELGQRQSNGEAGLKSTARSLIRPDGPISRQKPIRNLDESPRAKPATSPGAVGTVHHPRMPRSFLSALAQHPEGMNKGQLLTFTGYASSGSCSACFAEMLEEGWVDAPDKGTLRITKLGRDTLGPVDELPAGAELRKLRLDHPGLGPMGKAILTVLFEHYPESIAKGSILEATGYASSGSVSAMFAKLVRLGWAVNVGGALQAADIFFEES